jgi:hypothetical protein
VSDLDATPPRDRRGANWLHVDRGRISMAGQPVSPDAALASYAAVLGAVRSAMPGEPLELRSEDLVVLAAALGTDDRDVENRIRALLGCSRAEARRVHRELIRRRLLRPVAALAAGSLLVWGPAAAARSDRPKLLPAPSTTATTATTAAAATTSTSREATAVVAPASAPESVLPGATPAVAAPAGVAELPGEPLGESDSVKRGSGAATTRGTGDDGDDGDGAASSSAIGASSAVLGASSVIADVGDRGDPDAAGDEATG